MDEDIFVPLIVFSFILALIGMILSHSRWRLQQKMKVKENTENSLGTNELKGLILEAMHEANLPIMERIESLEKQLRTPKLNAAPKKEFSYEEEE